MLALVAKEEHAHSSLFGFSIAFGDGKSSQCHKDDRSSDQGDGKSSNSHYRVILHYFHFVVQGCKGLGFKQFYTSLYPITPRKRESGQYFPQITSL
jgi:hypothetical protein